MTGLQKSPDQRRQREQERQGRVNSWKGLRIPETIIAGLQSRPVVKKQQSVCLGVGAENLSHAMSAVFSLELCQATQKAVFKLYPILEWTCYFFFLSQKAEHLLK